ncbi:hypothetical protein J6590_017762 [Homalodisca vitripennis]|nr:hypothetical protein J6590_017762 [Homalodisca vitripennis]
MHMHGVITPCRHMQIAKGSLSIPGDKDNVSEQEKIWNRPLHWNSVFRQNGLLNVPRSSGVLGMLSGTTRLVNVPIPI